MIEIAHLTKKFKEAVVLNDISMTLEDAKIYGFIGRNGSGKTMLMKHILGFIRPTEGTVCIDGKYVGKDIDIPGNVGAIIENPGFLPEYSGYKNLKLLAGIRNKIGKEEIRNALSFVGLNPDDKKHVGKYSLGMKQRLGLAQAIMEDPDILLLDEPMNGLDDQGVEEMRKLLLAQKKAGKLVVIASHNKEDINLLCDEIFRFDHGKIVTKHHTESCNIPN